MWGKVPVTSIGISMEEQRNFPATLWYDTLMSHGPRKSSHSEASDCWDQSRTGDQITGRDGRKPELCQHRMREVGAGNALTLYLIKLGPLLLLTENLVCLCENLLKNLSFCDYTKGRKYTQQRRRDILCTGGPPSQHGIHTTLSPVWSQRQQKINDLTMGSAELAVLLLRKAEVMIAFVERLLCAG